MPDLFTPITEGGNNFKEFVNSPMRKKTNVSQTSRMAYEKGSPKRKSQCDIVFEAIVKGVNNILWLSEFTGLAEKAICGRVNNLIDEGSIQYSGTTMYKNRERKKIIVCN